MRLKTASVSALAILFGLASAGVSSAALLGVSIDPAEPLIIYDSQGQLRYRPDTGGLAITTNAIVVSDPVGGDGGPFIPLGLVDVAILVDAAGALVGGVPGDDLIVSGTVFRSVSGPVSGVLLTGEVSGFGFKDTGTPTDQYDLTFTVTGGLLADLFPPGSTVGMTVTSENSNFVGDFTVRFRGEAKGDIGVPVEECELEVDKTCCIPPPLAPPAEAFDCSDAKPIDSLSMIWDGQDGVFVRAWDGDPGGTLLDTVGPVNVGDEVTIAGMDGSPNDQVWEIFDGDPDAGGLLLGESTFHISCSDSAMNGPEDCGQPQGNGKDNDSSQLNDWLLEGMAGDLTLQCTPPEPDPMGETACQPTGGTTGDDCQGKVLAAVFEYTGDDCQGALPEGAKCEGSTGAATATVVVLKDESKIDVSPSTGIVVGDRITVAASAADSKGELASSLKLGVIGSGTQRLEIHTSCSKPLNVGMEFGSLRLVELTTTEGGTVTAEVTPVEFLDMCELPEAPPAPHCTTKVLGLTLRYLGGDCTVTNNQEGKALCLGPALAGDASVVILKDPDKISANPSSGIGVGETFTISKNDGKELGSETRFAASDGVGTQSIKLHTSCSKPLNLGDRFGAFEVFALDRKDTSPVSIGGVVEYQYKITNPNADAIDVTSVFDDTLGELLDDPPLPIGPGDMATLFETTTLTESTKSTVFVNGVGGVGGNAQCEAMDMLTVDIIPPPPPPPEAFVCSDAKPIDSLSMIWDGQDGVFVKAWDGSPGGTLLDTVGPVNAGDEVTIAGMDGSPNDQVWEIFDGDPGAGGAQLGESTFHISCSDSAMNGPEDCGQPQGDGKGDDSSQLNDWLLEGMAGDLALDCTP